MGALDLTSPAEATTSSGRAALLAIDYEVLRGDLALAFSRAEQLRREPALNDDTRWELEQLATDVRLKLFGVRGRAAAEAYAQLAERFPESARSHLAAARAAYRAAGLFAEEQQVERRLVELDQFHARMEAVANVLMPPKVADGDGEKEADIE